MANGKSSTKDFFKATGAMPSTSMDGKILSQIIKMTGIKRHMMRTASAITAPLALLTLCMLPSILKALSVVSGIASVAIVAFFAYRMLGAKGATTDAGQALRKNRRHITAEELEARKARAYSFGRQGQGGNATKTMTVN